MLFFVFYARLHITNSFYAQVHIVQLKGYEGVPQFSLEPDPFSIYPQKEQRSRYNTKTLQLISRRIRHINRDPLVIQLRGLCGKR